MESVLQISVRVFAERGFDSTSMEHLAAALGLSKSAIYHHVSSKDDLLRIALDRALDGLQNVVAEAQALQAPAIGRLEFLVRGSVRVLLERLPYVTLLLRVRGNTLVERRALSRRREFDRFAADLVRQAQEDGDIRTDIDEVITARLLFGVVNSLTDWVRPTVRRDADWLCEMVCTFVFQGLRVSTHLPEITHGQGRVV
jgi:AcrR family transcriptional regulator